MTPTSPAPAEASDRNGSDEHAGPRLGVALLHGYAPGALQPFPACVLRLAGAALPAPDTMIAANPDTDTRIDSEPLGADLSGGWREIYAALDVNLGELDRLLVATRTDRSARYRRKHRLGVSS